MLFSGIFCVFCTKRGEVRAPLKRKDNSYIYKLKRSALITGKAWCCHRYPQTNNYFKQVTNMFPLYHHEDTISAPLSDRFESPHAGEKCPFVFWAILEWNFVPLNSN